MTPASDRPRATPDRAATSRRIRRGALRAALIYAALGAIWIVFSDRLVELAVQDPGVRATIQTWKGLLFVALSAVAVGVLAFRELRREHASGDQLAALAELSAAGIYVLRDGTITVVNDRVVDMLRAGSRSEIEGRHVRDFLDVEDEGEVEAGLADLTENGPGEPRRLRIRRMDGTFMLAEIDARSVDWYGRRAEVGVMLDVTALEAERERERARARLETIGQLTAAISHDLRNMLTTISVPLDVARDRLPRDAPGRREVEEAAAASDRAIALTRQLLAFGRPGPSEPVPIDLSAWLAEAEPMLKRAVGPGVTLEFDVEPGVPAVEIDPSGLSQVLLNLALNAAEAMDGAGSAEIRVARSGGPVPRVRVSVADSGPGIDPAVVPNLFEPFFTTKDSGTGLGLATVRRIVEEAGGTIEPDLDVGRGARFVLEFPASDRPADPKAVAFPTEAAPSRRVRSSPATVVVVEDERVVRQGVRRALERAGFHVREAATCEEARAAFRTDPRPVVLVTDVDLPDGSGLDVAVEATSADAGLRVVVVSGSSNSDGASKLPGATFVEKPFTISDLVVAVRAARDRAFEHSP